MRLLPLSIAIVSVLTVSAGLSSASTILVQDNFNSLTAGTDLHTRSDFTNNTGISGLAWVARTTGTPMEGAVGGGALATFTQTQTSGIDLGAGFFSTPGIYRLSATITHPSDFGRSWVGFGFSGAATLSLSENMTFSTNAAGPWLFYRSDGEVNFRTSGGNTARTVTGYLAEAPRTFELIIDTSGANWTLQATIGGTPVDLNGAAAGEAYVYSSGAPSIRQIVISNGTVTGSSGTPILDDFTLSFTPIPEPSGMVLAVLSAGAFFLRRRR